MAETGKRMNHRPAKKPKVCGECKKNHHASCLSLTCACAKCYTDLQSGGNDDRR